MCTPHYELSRYGYGRLQRIARFLRYGGDGFTSLFGESITWERGIIESSSSKTILLDSISRCGAFQSIPEKFNSSWDRLLVSLTVDRLLLTGFFNMFGIESPGSNATVCLRRIVNKLSVVYMFPGDPIHPTSRKRMNDIRLNAMIRRNLIERNPLEIARSFGTFRETLEDPIVRTIFWNQYVRGVGGFTISVSNLDQIVGFDDCCSICMEEFSYDIPGIELHPCRHVFHIQCIQNLMRYTTTRGVLCPMCRSEVRDLGKSIEKKS